jgi:hypothetical protein
METIVCFKLILKMQLYVCRVTMANIIEAIWVGNTQNASTANQGHFKPFYDEVV